MVISKICTNCRSGILGEFLGVNVRFPAREGGCPPPVTVCEKPSLKSALLGPGAKNRVLKRYFEKKCNRVASGGARWDPITLLAKVPIGITSYEGVHGSPKFGTGHSRKKFGS